MHIYNKQFSSRTRMHGNNNHQQRTIPERILFHGSRLAQKRPMQVTVHKVVWCATNPRASTTGKMWCGIMNLVSARTSDVRREVHPKSNETFLENFVHGTDQIRDGSVIFLGCFIRMEWDLLIDATTHVSQDDYIRLLDEQGLSWTQHWYLQELYQDSNCRVHRANTVCMLDTTGIQKYYFI